MPSSVCRVTYLLLLFCGLAYSCGSAEYEINGECCPMCTPGTRVYKHCTEYTSTSCIPCIQKSFIAVPNGLSHCLPCIVCDPDLGLKTERECTPTSDTVCGPLGHHYCTKTDNKGCSFAQKHTICRPGQFIIHSGTTLTNTECGDCPDKTFSNESFSAYCKPHTDCQSLGLQEITAGTNTLDNECGPRNSPVSIVIVTLLLVLVSVVILTVIFILKRRKKNGPTDPEEGERMTSTDQPQDEERRKKNGPTDPEEGERMTSTDQPQDEVCEPDLGLKTERECTPTSDTVCGPLDHHYCTKTDNKGCTFAQKHTICRPGQFIIHNGTTLTNTECGDCPDKTFSDESFPAYCKPHTDCLSFGLQEMTAGTNTSDSECAPRNIPVYIIIVPVLLALAVILAIIFILRKFLPLSERGKKSMATDLTERERMNRTNQPQDEGEEHS